METKTAMESHTFTTTTTMPKVSIKIIDENMIEYNQNMEQHFAKENLEFPDCECVFHYALERPEVIFPTHGR
jgi:hypothetical protein